MTPQDYDRWYASPRGRWIGETEFALLHRMLHAQPGASLLDVGCGTGWFSRRFAERDALRVTGLDPNAEWLEYARRRAVRLDWVEGDARKLPFADASFDAVVSVTALCFVADWPQGLKEMLRVARRRVVLGLLNRRSLLWLEKGRGGGVGNYRGAHWHTTAEVRAALAALPIARPEMRTAIFLPSGSALARSTEVLLPGWLPYGGFMAVAADIEP